MDRSAPSEPVVSTRPTRAVTSNSHLKYDSLVTASKVSLSIEESVLAEARERVGRRELSAYVTEALRRQLQHDRLGELLVQMDSESGPIPNELIEEARELWRGPAAPRRPRRTA
jgi:hypothetical protein